MRKTSIAKKRADLEERAEKYWNTCIERACRDISNTKSGNRNNQVNKSAYALGQVYQGLESIGVNPEPNETIVKIDLYRAINSMSKPLPEQEAQNLVIRSFTQGKTQARDLLFLKNNEYKNNEKSISSTEKTTPNKVQIRWITDMDNKRFSFLEEDKLKPRDATQDDIKRINDILKKYFELFSFNFLNLKIHETESGIGIILWDTKDIIYNPVEIEDRIIYLEGRTDLITAVTFRLHEDYKLVSKYNKESKYIINNSEALNIFFMDSDVSEEHIKSKIKCTSQLRCKFIRFPKSKDYSDFTFKGGDREFVEKLIEEAELKIIRKQTVIKNVMTANKRLELAKLLPPIKKLFGQIIHENELVILFGTTGCGKSIISVQIAEAFANGDSLFGYPNEAGKQKVLYFDFELSHQQFLKRYSDKHGNPHSFTDNLLFYNFDLNEIIDSINGKNLQDYMFDKICLLIQETKASVIIIDNITYLDSESLTDGDKALKMMKILNKIKIDEKVTIIVVAHTPKRKNTNKLTIGDLAGSSNISNFADNVIGMNISGTEDNYRYIKQVKASRSAPIELHDNNVLVLEINKTDKLYFKTVKYDMEKNHVIEMNNSDIDRQEHINKVVELLEQGKTYEEVSEEMGISKGTISKWRKKYPEKFKGDT